MTAPTVIVCGSVNLDIVATAAHLPAPGETVTGAQLARHPGGKGANQALAAQRLGARTAMVARVGADAEADLALALLRDGGVDLGRVRVDEAAPTGVALIAVAEGGENQIVVAPGANDRLSADDIGALEADAVICQLEIPNAAVAAAADRATGLFCVNLAPARAVPPEVLKRADLIVVNDGEAAFYGEALKQGGGWLAVTHGARGASLYRAGELVAEAAPPAVEAVDTVGAGDCFTAGLVVALAEGQDAPEALRFACACGALAATRPGAQPALPMRAEVDAILGPNRKDV